MTTSFLRGVGGLFVSVFLFMGFNVNPAFNSPAKGLTYRQRALVGTNVKSVLSVPMKYPKSAKMVGVLSLDSGFNIDRTFFEREEVSKKLDAWARVFGRMLFEDGVRPR